MFLGGIPGSIYLLKVNGRNAKARCEIFPKLTIKTSDVVLGSVLSTLNIFGTLL